MRSTASLLPRGKQGSATRSTEPRRAQAETDHNDNPPRARYPANPTAGTNQTSQLLASAWSPQQAPARRDRSGSARAQSRSPGAQMKRPLATPPCEGGSLARALPGRRPRLWQGPAVALLFYAGCLTAGPSTGAAGRRVLTSIQRCAVGILACVTARMHANELEIDESLVRRLLADQFPEWGNLALRRIEQSGTDHAIFRLGDELSVRLPRVDGPSEPGSKESVWLPKLGPLLPVDVPVPVAQGRPGAGYPWFWEIHSWVHGETVPIETIDAIQVARDLCALIEALQRVRSAGAPPGRGIPLAERDERVRYWLARFDGDPRIGAGWESALAAPPWNGPPVWHHGDLDARNWLIHAGRISGVIDWSSMGVGDPACDSMVAWKPIRPRPAMRSAKRCRADDATWERARGWVSHKQSRSSPTTHPRTTRPCSTKAESWLELALPNKCAEASGYARKALSRLPSPLGEPSDWLPLRRRLEPKRSRRSRRQRRPDN